MPIATNKKEIVRVLQRRFFLATLTLIQVALNFFVVQPARAGTFTNTGAMHFGREHFTATPLLNGRVLVAGGSYSNTAELYDPATRTWLPTGNMISNAAASSGRAFHSAVLLTNGQVLVMGGKDSWTWTQRYSSAELYNPSNDTWTATGEMSTPRGDPAACLLPNGKVIVVGSAPGAELYDPETGTWSMSGPTNISHGGPAILLRTGKVLFGNELFDPDTGSWTATGSPLLAHTAATATLMSNGEVLMVGGPDLANAETYDPNTGMWTVTGSLNIPRYLQVATALPNGSVLVTGGFSLGTFLTQAELYDPSSRTWNLTGSQVQGRVWHAAALLASQKVLVVGGSGPMSSAELYDSGHGALKVTLLPTNVVTAGAQWQVNGEAFQNSDTILTNLPVSLNPSLSFKLVAGWVTPADQSLLLSENVTNTIVVEYTRVDTNKPTLTITSPKLNQRWSNSVFTATATVRDNFAASNVFYRVNGGSWISAQPAFTPTGALNTPRVGHAATLLRNGKVLVAGGANGAELYDPGTGAWSKIGSATLSHGGPAFLLHSGKVLFVGSSELYDPATGKWTATGNLDTGGSPGYNRQRYTATLLSDGKVLVAGGMTYGFAGPILYDPATGQWASTGPMKHYRDQHAATLLPDGGVLVTGGFDYSHGAGTSGEIYNPATGLWTETYSPVVERIGHTATLLSNGKVLLVGGEQPGIPFSQPEIYDPATGAWALILGVKIPAGSVATLLGNDQVLFTGDTHSSNAAFSNANVYDPISGVCKAVGPLLHARNGHTATLLANGKVLIVGGYNDDGNISQAELYDPNKWAAPVPLQAGTNTIEAYAVDYSGNVSTTNLVHLNYVLSDRPVLNINGQGHVSPNFNGAFLAISNSYTFAALPASGFTFANWTGSLTNTSARLTFVMRSNLVLTANFFDSSRPVIVITQPKLNQQKTNSTFSAQGKARDNVGVAAVWYQFNGLGWHLATVADDGTNWSTPDFTLRSGSNLIQAFALDAAGNTSLTNRARFSFLVQPGTDWAPDSLNGLLAQLGSNQTNTASIGFDPVTFALASAGTNSDDSGVGNYHYTKTGTNTAHLNITFTAPPALTNNSGAADFIFTNYWQGSFTNEESLLTATRFKIAPDWLPGALAGKTLILLNAGNDTTNTIKFLDVAHFQQPNPGTNASAGGYTLTRYSPVGGMLALDLTSGPTTPHTALIQLNFTNSSSGNYLVSFPAGTNTLQQSSSGKFKLQ